MGWFERKAKKVPLERLREAVIASDTVSLREVLATHPELLNVQDENGATPLHWAAEKQDLSAVAALVDLGADVKIRTVHGKLPRDFAFAYGEFRMGCYSEVCLKIVERLDASSRLH